MLVGRRAALDLAFERLINEMSGALAVCMARRATPRSERGREDEVETMQDHKNTILAIVLSAIVLIGWQYFFATPQAEKQRLLAEQQRQAQMQTQPAAPAGGPGTQPSNVPLAPGQVGTAATPIARDKAIEATPRVAIDTPSVKGSIAFEARGSTISRWSNIARPSIRNRRRSCCCRPSGTADPFYAEFGWVGAPAPTSRRRMPKPIGGKRVRARSGRPPDHACLRQRRGA